mmetsp:Transcript_4429/g.7308  ORF Transcript_4429/g.7308 Transcript_4429/m.7308 type:complete len:205 (-) Transcript_4429:503-1117(-)
MCPSHRTPASDLLSGPRLEPGNLIPGGVRGGLVVSCVSRLAQLPPPARVAAAEHRRRARVLERCGGVAGRKPQPAPQHEARVQPRRTTRCGLSPTNAAHADADALAHARPHELLLRAGMPQLALEVAAVGAHLELKLASRPALVPPPSREGPVLLLAVEEDDTVPAVPVLALLDALREHELRPTECLLPLAAAPRRGLGRQRLL